MENIETRPWGHFTLFNQGVGHWLKGLSINPDKQISLQRHKGRKEIWVVLYGEGLVTKEQDGLLRTREVKSGEIVSIPKNCIHRIKNTGKGVLQLAEIALGECDEADIERLSDDYGRK